MAVVLQLVFLMKLHRLRAAGWQGMLFAVRNTCFVMISIEKQDSPFLSGITSMVPDVDCGPRDFTFYFSFH